MPRWLLPGLIIAVAALAMTFLNAKRIKIPEDCQKAGSALKANDYNLAIDHYLLCLDAGELATETLAQVYYGLGIAYSAKGSHNQAIKDYSEAPRWTLGGGWRT